MNDKAKQELEPKSDEVKPKKKAGRKAMSPEEKVAAAKVRAAEKEKASSLKPELIVQYQGSEIDLDKLVEAAKADFHAEKKRTLITGLKLYIKPDENMAYYVVNEKFQGKIPF